jgi:cytochrome c-type biogenesis protein CcmF
MEFVGEHLIIGLIGKGCIYIAIGLAFLSMISYAISCCEWLKTHRLWRYNARNLFRLHTFFLLIATALLLHMIWYHYFEYHYVWQYSSKDLGAGYLISSLWAGQEGSFLLWALFQGLIGVIVMKRSNSWEMPVMLVISFAQLFLVLAVTGINIGFLKIGISPFELLREMPENNGLSFFADANYISKLGDGVGLNPLLMNFWMKIHPPVLFLGFASLIVPFAFALSSLFKKDYFSWIRPALPWVAFSALMLGCGLIFGGAWAYEDLTFGGFWAWDPVENSSLVPWIFIVAALHLLIVSMRKGQSLALTYPVVILSYLLVLYSTFLTRSGILSATSVHAFAGSGMSELILVFLIILFAIAVTIYVIRIRHFPKSQSDYFFSREFWMFAGSVILLLSAFQILFSTSLPLINKIFGTALTLQGAENVKNYYNMWQAPFAILILLMATFSQHLLFGKTLFKFFFKRIILSFILTCALTFTVLHYSGISETRSAILLFSGIFISLSVLDYVFRYDYRFANKASLLSHFGLGVFVVGIVLAFGNSTTISKNVLPVNIGKRFDTKEYMMIPKDKVLPLGDYYICYSKRSIENNKVSYQLDFLKKNKSAQYYKAFSLYPSIQLNQTMGNVFVPDTKHLINKDVFSYVAYSQMTSATDTNSYTKLFESLVKLKNTITYEGFKIHLDNLTINPQKEKITEENVSITATLSVQTPDSTKYSVKPVYSIENSFVKYSDAGIGKDVYKVRFERVSTTKGAIICGIYQKKPDYVIIKSIVFPFIIFVWAGAFLMLCGFVISIVYRGKSMHTEYAKKIGIID